MIFSYHIYVFHNINPHKFIKFYSKSVYKVAQGFQHEINPYKKGISSFNTDKLKNNIQSLRFSSQHNLYFLTIVSYFSINSNYSKETIIELCCRLFS